jgi:hypothetical protein
VILTKRKHDAFPNENVPNVWEKCKIYGYWWPWTGWFT